MSLDRFNKLLETNSGITYQLIQNTFSESSEKRPSSSLFFRPYQSGTDVLLRASSILSAPICQGIMSLEFLLISFTAAFKSLKNAISGYPNTAKEQADTVIDGLIYFGIFLLGSILSSIINLVDFIGSCFTSIKQKQINSTPARTELAPM